jgi:hypothetical protein
MFFQFIVEEAVMVIFRVWTLAGQSYRDPLLQPYPYTAYDKFLWSRLFIAFATQRLEGMNSYCYKQTREDLVEVLAWRFSPRRNPDE